MQTEKINSFPVIISGPKHSGKSFLASKYTGDTIHSSQLKRKDMYHYLLNIFRDNVILKYTSVYEVIEGEVISISHNSITLKNNEIESVYSTGPLFRMALLKENVLLNDKIRFNISTGKLNKVIEIESNGELQKSKTIQSELSLLTIDNLNSNFNILSLNKINDSVRKIVNKNVKECLNDKSKLKINHLKIEDIHLLSLDELNILNDLLYEEYKPNLIFTVNSDKLGEEEKKSNLFKRCDILRVKKEDVIESIKKEMMIDGIKIEENVKSFLADNPERLEDVIDCVKIMSVDKKRNFEKLINELN